MSSNHPDSSNHSNRLFHISEEAEINIFDPRPSPSHFHSITGDIVFAIGEDLLHNYLLPRDCPRITYYSTPKTTDADKKKFIGNSAASHIIIVKSGCYQQMKETVLFCYEFGSEDFVLLDECAGYFISYKISYTTVC